jgi:hypothetical protein
LQVGDLFSQISTGSVSLYKLKDPDGVADKYDLPFEVIETVDVNNNFTDGYVFDNLTGNTEFVYKLEGHFSTGINAASGLSLRFQINGDSGSNYIEQALEGIGASVFASTSTRSYGRLLATSPSQVSQFSMYIFPKSGSNRPMLLEAGYREAQIDKVANWWLNQSDEITSIKVFSGGSSTVIGKLTLSKIPLTSSPSSSGTLSTGQVALSPSSTYTTGVYPVISGENSIEMLSKTGDFELQADFVKMSLKRSDSSFDVSQMELAEGYRVDEDYNVLNQSDSNIFVYPPKLLRRIYNPPTDFDNLGQPKAGVVVDVATSPVISKVYYGMFQFEVALNKSLNENVVVDVFMKTTPWIIHSYWNSRQAQFDWDGTAYKTAGAVEFKFEVR